MVQWALREILANGWQRLVREDNPHGNYIEVYTAADQNDNRYGCGWFLGSCAVGGLKSFIHMGNFSSWQDKAEFMAVLYRALYSRGNVLYCLAGYQQSNPAHQALLEIGARQIDEFPNLFHGPEQALIFRVNIRNAAGRFCNKYGEAYTSEGAVNPDDVITEQTKKQPGGFQFIPKRGE